MTAVPLDYFLTLSSILFVLGVFGVFFNHRNIILVLMSLELVLLAVNVNLVAFSAYLGNLAGQVFALFVLAVAAAEAAVGLAILVVWFRRQQGVSLADATKLKG